MVIIGPLAATNSLRRGVGVLGLDAKTFYVIPISAIFIFAVLAFFAYRYRRQPAIHKRLILIATIGLIDAAVGRWPVAFFQNNPKAQDLIPFGFLLAVMVYDLVTQKRILKTYTVGLALPGCHPSDASPHCLHAPLAGFCHLHARQGIEGAKVAARMRQ